MILQIIYALKNINYLLLAGHKNGHGIHSPFIFNLIKEVFNKKTIHPDLKDVLHLYSKIKSSKEPIESTYYGAGSVYSESKEMPLRLIAKRSGLPTKYGKLLFNLIQFAAPQTILELGTSVGISSLFIASAAKKADFFTIEGSLPKLTKAKELADNLGLKNIHFINGNFDHVLEPVLAEIPKLDFVFIDGNHKKNPTLKYFELCLNKSHPNSVFIFDDIHWSDEMENAWEEIKRNPKVRVSIDIFRMGIVFFRAELSYQHYVLKF
ncbi:MAG: O-methyltransferase [Bacteroidales bacterium]